MLDQNWQRKKLPLSGFLFSIGCARVRVRKRKEEKCSVVYDQFSEVDFLHHRSFQFLCNCAFSSFFNRLRRETGGVPIILG
jgi:hypothetical protein